MANKKGNTSKQKTNTKKNVKKIQKTNTNRNSIVIKLLIVLGVIILCIAIVSLMNYFFVKKSNIKINISTDKDLIYLTINNKEELLTTQRYVSDLGYSMRYDVDNFTVFKYKEQDIFKFISDEKALLVIEKSLLPSNCSQTTLANEYNNCVVNVDDYTEEYYVTTEGETYKITLKSPNTEEFNKNTKIIMKYMLNTFKLVPEE